MIIEEVVICLWLLSSISNQQQRANMNLSLTCLVHSMLNFHIHHLYQYTTLECEYCTFHHRKEKYEYLHQMVMLILGLLSFWLLCFTSRIFPLFFKTNRDRNAKFYDALEQIMLSLKIMVEWNENGNNVQEYSWQTWWIFLVFGYFTRSVPSALPYGWHWL